jgi:hypothetical protein
MAFWDRGVAELAEGQTEEALMAFRRAREHQPLDALLAAWEAKALSADDNDLEACALLDEVLRVAPSFSEARYQRAACRMRLGRLDDAAVDLSIALDEELIPPSSVLSDPDFASARGHPAFSFLPGASLQAQWSAQPATVFLGNDLKLTLTVFGAVDGPLELVPSGFKGSFRLTEVTEVHRATTAEPMTEIVWTLRATGSGLTPLEHRVLRSGRHTVELPSIVLKAVAPPEHVATLSESELISPAARFAARGEAVRWDDGRCSILDPGAAPTEGVVYRLDQVGAVCSERWGR